MKTYLHTGIMLFIMSLSLTASAQVPVNNSCINALNVCSTDTMTYACCSGGGCGSVYLQTWYYFCLGEDMDSTQSISFQSQFGYRAYTIYGPEVDNCSEVGTSSVYLTDTIGIPNPIVITGLPAGRYYIKLGVIECYGYVHAALEGFTSSECLACTEVPCENCIGSFAPEPGKKYMINAWVKEDSPALTKTDYTYPGISLEFPNVSVTLGPFSPSGVIIDGWQRLEQEFTIPAGANQMDIVLSCSTGDCFFDDIKVFPYDGSMKCYVYNPETLLLEAEMDERHYATFYEYNEEGKLVRIKKETERGIMTIQESNTTVVKQ